MKDQNNIPVPESTFLFEASSSSVTTDKSIPEKNGQKCPRCTEPLFDLHPNRIFTSHPAQKETGCLACGYTGYRTI